MCHARGSRCVTIEDRGSRCVTLEDRGESRLRIEDRGVVIEDRGVANNYKRPKFCPVRRSINFSVSNIVHYQTVGRWSM